MQKDPFDELFEALQAVPYDQLGTEDQDSVSLIKPSKSDEMEQNSLHEQISNSDSEQHTESEISDLCSSKKASVDKDHIKVDSGSTVPLDKGNEMLKSVSETATR